MPTNEAFVVMAIDPGVTTGIAIYTNGDFHGCEVTSYAEVAELIKERAPNTVVIENFIVRKGKPGLYHPSIRMIGVVDFICIKRGIKFVIQSPSILPMMKNEIPDSLKSPHVRSAASHLIYYLKKIGKEL